MADLILTLTELEDAFDYLDLLRESGVVNMYGARPYLVRDCELNNKQASKALCLWMDTYEQGASVAKRAKQAFQKLKE